MTVVANSISEAAFLEAPRNSYVGALYEYWNNLRGDRAMPSRTDIDPVNIPKLLPYIMMYDVVPGGGYTIRLVGEEVQQFVGRNTTGRPAGSIMTTRSAEIMIKILDLVATERVPKFRAGKAHWHPDKSFRNFEACFLPLSSDGTTVDVILVAVRFPLE